MNETYDNVIGFIQANSLTYTEIKRDLTKFVNALSEDEKLGFKTLFAGTNAQILIDAISAKQSAENYQIIASRNENLLQYCNRIDSATAISQNYGYSVRRGSNIKMRVTFTSEQTVKLDKFSSICTVDEYYLIIDEPVELVAGQEITVDGYLGIVKEQTLSANTEDLLIFRFTNQNVSDQIALYLDGTEVPHTTNMLEMLEDKYLCLSNAYSSVDAIYLNKRTDFTHRYSNTSKLTLRYIEYQAVELSSVELEGLYGEVSQAEQIAPTIKPESLTSIKVDSRLYAETQNRIVARDDFQSVFKLEHPELADATGRDYSNAIVEVSYVKKDGSLFTPVEYENAYNDLSKRRGYGIPMCYITHPDVMLNLTLNVILQLTSSNSASVKPIVRDVLSSYEFKLGGMIDFSSIEHELEGYKIVKTARTSVSYQSYRGGIHVPEGTTFIPSKDNGKLYVVRNLLYLTGSSAPSWPTTIGEEVNDGDVVWACKAKSRTMQPFWKPDTSVQIGENVWVEGIDDVQYECIKYIFKTGNTEPSWPTVLGDTIIDNQILWMAIDKVYTSKVWEKDTLIEKGAIVNATYNTRLSYQAINYLPLTSNNEPSWSTDGTVFTDRAVQYAIINKDYDDMNPTLSNLQLGWNQYIKFNENVVVV